MKNLTPLKACLKKTGPFRHALILIACAFGCAHEPIEQSAPVPYASQSTPHFSNAAPITLAQKNYNNGLVSEAFAGLMSAYQENPDTKYLEYAASLVDQEIAWMKSTLQVKSLQLHDANIVLATFFEDKKVKADVVGTTAGVVLATMPLMPAELIGGYSYQKAKNEKLGLQKKKAEFVCDSLRSDNIEKFSKETFIPRIDYAKNAMLKIQPLLSSLLSAPSPDYDRLLALKLKIQNQREIICNLRIQYISEIFIGPRVSLGDKLVFLARCDRPNIAGMWPGSLNSYWINKLALLFTKDYGDWIAQSDEQTRLKYKELANNSRDAIGAAGFVDFETTLDLLSNNKNGGSDFWWPPETQK